MASCGSCGSYIPEGQGNCCSMCYGDIAYGNDHYYEEWVRNQEESFIQKQIEDDIFGEEIKYDLNF